MRRPEPLSPDPGNPRWFRSSGRTYYTAAAKLVWEEGPPDFVLEVQSDATAKKDNDEKLAVYREIGVREYWLFYAREPHRGRRLRVHRLAGGDWLPVAVGPDGVVRREALGLGLREDGNWLWLRDPRTRLDIPTAADNDRLRWLAETRVELAEAERDRAAHAQREAETELARLRSLLESEQHHRDPG